MTNGIKAILTTILVLMAVSAMAGTAAADLPATFDWRDVNGTNYVTPPKMNPCGACWAYAAIGVVESKILIEHGIETDLSEQYFMSECFPWGDCSGGFPDDVLAGVRSFGAMSEECMPKSLNDMSCNYCDDWAEDAWFITGRSWLYSPTTSGIKNTIMQHGPVTATVYPGHAAVIVGWNDSLDGGSWIIKDSGGTYAGDEGYITVWYNNVSEIQYVWSSYQPCDRYDTNGDPGIQLDELTTAQQDLPTCTISAVAYDLVYACYVEANPCEAYDTNNDCTIDISEMGNALDDWYADIISISTMGAVLDCWAAGSHC